MAFMFKGNERKGRRKHSSKKDKDTKTQPTAHNAYASASAVHIHNHNYAAAPIPTLQVSSDGYAYPGFSASPPQHPIYGAAPEPYDSQPWQPSPPLQPVQPYAGNSTISIATSYPPRVEGKLKTSWNKVDRLAAKSYGDLRGTLTSGAGKSKTQINDYVDQSTNLISKKSAQLNGYVDDSTNLISKKSTQALNQGAALCDILCGKLDAVITSIDGEKFSGQEQDLMVDPNLEPSPSVSSVHSEFTRGFAPNPVYPSTSKAMSQGRASNHFSKAWLYSNSRLPPHLPPFKVFTPTYPLLCLAANYSEKVYTPPAPRTSEHESHVASDWRSGTKAMVLKSVPIDDLNVIVFAVRGSQTFMDWAVNFRQAPSSPDGFLDDEGNLCHAGFLQVARKMLKPVSDRLKTLLEENPGRSNASLLITGHSAGGAVAALLFAHMLSSRVTSELNYLTGFFKRVHCVTFGAPPVSLLPLQKPEGRKHRKSLFFSFINEGDPVPRADKQIVRSLLKLYASPAPSAVSASTSSALVAMSQLHLPASTTTTLATTSSKPSKHSKLSKSSKTSKATTTLPHWPIPPSTLSTAGRLIVMRSKGGSGRGEEVEAVTIEDEMLRETVFGDPVMHMMSEYRKRVVWLATNAVTARGY
ncbi:alpha/beta-hydrolase [Polyplosphaeria fusca]|uniref:Alpha/beta-hydrolase n=1 Tax=Polyplosphaeria fusca TaxID=682080 RepID=A0A9P4QYF7_9PLEO|nr:alpha/beta-hydrolase [Polyplosphaeria fusca]